MSKELSVSANEGIRAIQFLDRTEEGKEITLDGNRYFKDDEKYYKYDGSFWREINFQKPSNSFNDFIPTDLEQKRKVQVDAARKKWSAGKRRSSRRRRGSRKRRSSRKRR